MDRMSLFTGEFNVYSVIFVKVLCEVIPTIVDLSIVNAREETYNSSGIVLHQQPATYNLSRFNDMSLVSL
ncbi:unnamed protein product [Hermetia illucens]|uniref:Uncharacterized protein n=1 Tax=Hermetia illucens TaxID=343691 RepID=A0A7R8UGZ9_HERIL|nr:unnamed protein product [Hermetia illucens]